MSQDRPRTSIDDQVKAVERELRYRQRVYPRWVDAGKMSAAKMEHELRCMTDVLATLQGLQGRNRLL